MSLTLMQLGPWQFSVPGMVHDRLQRRFDYRWIPMMRVGRRPAMQYTGPGIEKVDLRGVMYPSCPELANGPTGNSYTQLLAMRQAAILGNPYPLAGIQGFYFGRWCIVMIRDEQEFFNRDNTPRKLEFSIDLVAYGEGFN